MKADLDLSPQLAAELAEMSPKEHAYFRSALRDRNSTRAALKQLYNVDYAHKPASIQEFLMDQSLLGGVAQIRDWDSPEMNPGGGLYRFWKPVLADLFAPGARYQQLILSVSIGCGKTFVSIICLLYKLYLLLEMRDPQDFLGLAKATPIVFGFFSATKHLSQADEQRVLINVLETSPFFRRMAKIKDSSRPFEFLKFPHGIQFSFGSRLTHTLGMNLYAALLDEFAFGVLTGDRQMQELFDSTYRRLTSRYSNAATHGLVIVSSSRASKSDFVERHLNKWAGQRDLVKIVSASTWEVKPHEFPATSTFSVAVGDQIRPSRLLQKGELPPPGLQVIRVPNHFQLRHQFEIDVEGALRDFGNIAVADESPLIVLREKIQTCIDRTRKHPFTVETVFAGTHDTLQIEQLFKLDLVTVRKVTRRVPSINPAAPRFIHCDIGLTNDALGIAMVHLSGTRAIETLNPVGELEAAELPEIFVDLVLQVRAHPGDQVELRKVLKFILFLNHQAGYPIESVSFDSYASEMIMQDLARLNFNVERLSVDRSDTAFLTLASIIQAEAISYYEYPVLLRELRELKRDLAKRKVDHPALSADGSPGSKDCADALCGAVFNAGKNPRAFWQPDLQPHTDRDDILRGDANKKDPSDLSWVTGTARRVKVLGAPEFVPKDIFGNPAIK
jgi:hypothetical protein